MMNWLLTPLAYQFMQRGLLAAIMVGVLCAVIGCYVVLRSMAFMGDALAHAILPGVAISYLMGGNLTIGAIIAAVIASLGIGVISRKGTIKEDTAIGILFSAALALGIALISSIRTYAVDLSHILFGNVLGISTSDLWLTALVGAAILLIIALLYRPLLIVTFDPILATTLQLPVEALRLLILVMLSMVIVVSIQSVGVTLVAAMLVTPAATAYLLTRRLPAMMGTSALFGALSGLIGLYLSYYLNIASGASIVLVATLLFVMAFLFSPQKGLVWQKIWRYQKQ